jgi:hypothetical protein
VITENRVYAACYSKKWRDVSGFYRNVQTEYSSPAH